MFNFVKNAVGKVRNKISVSLWKLSWKLSRNKNKFSTPIEFMTTKEICKELDNRCDAAIVMCIKELNIDAKPQDESKKSVFIFHTLDGKTVKYNKMEKEVLMSLLQESMR